MALPFTIAGEDPTRGELRDRVRDVIDLVDLTGKEHHKPDQLSAGEQQRVAIARALVTRPALLFADEPTGNLDYTTGTEILDALWRSCVGRGQTIVLVTHDSKAAAYADRVHVIGDGTIRDTIELGRRESHDADPAHRAASPSSACRRPMLASTASPGAASRARPLRAGLSALGVALGVAVLFAGLATNAGIDASVDAHGPRPRRQRRPARRRLRRGRPGRARPSRRSRPRPASRSPRRRSSAGPTSRPELERGRRACRRR